MKEVTYKNGCTSFQRSVLMGTVNNFKYTALENTYQATDNGGTQFPFMYLA